MAHTEFKYGVPYNTIRLGADVAQWMQHGQSYLDYSSFKPTGQVSMGQLQALATVTPNVDPTGSGNYAGYPAMGRKWGIGNATDQNTGAGILNGQAGGTSDWVGTRNYNFASNPQNIRLSYLSGLDYTAVMELEDRQGNFGQNERDSFVLLDEDATDRYWCTAQPVEMFTDEPLFAAAVRDTSANRHLYVIRTGVMGDKFSDINDENWIRIGNATDTNDIISMCSITENLGSTYSSNRPAFVTAGRRTANSNNCKVTLFLYNKGTNGLSPTLTEGAQINVDFGTNNSVPDGICYIADNRVMMKMSRGANVSKVVGLSYGSGWAAGTVTTLGGGNGYGAVRGDMISLRDEYNPSGNDGEAIAVWAANRSTYNSNIYAQRIRQNTTTLTLSTQRTLITDSNNIKACRACLLATDSANAWIGVVRSDTSGDATISVHKYSYGGDSFTLVGSFKHDYNDTSLNNILSITPMGRNYKNQNSFVGETFQPGQSNNYDRIVWFKVLLATNVDTDDVTEIHGYVNLDGTGTQVFEKLNSDISTGRNSYTQRCDFNTDGRKWCKGQYPLGSGTDWVMTTAAYYSTSPSNDYAAVTYVNGLDRLYDWNVFQVDLNPASKTPPGPTGSDYVISTNVGAQPGPNNPSGGYVYGRWYVGPSNGKLNQNSFLSSSNYMTVEYYKKGEGFFYGSFGSGTQMMGFDDTDIDGNRWGTYWGQLKSHVESGNNVTMRVFDQNNSSSLFTISSTVGSGPTNRGEDEIKILDSDRLVIRWTGGANGHSGNTFTLWEGPSVNQVKVGFQYTP